MKIRISLSVDSEIRADKKKVERQFKQGQKTRRYEESDEPDVDRATEHSDIDGEECSNLHSDQHSQ